MALQNGFSKMVLKGALENGFTSAGMHGMHANPPFDAR